MTTLLITGANRGIGLEFVLQYLAEGAEVIACCRQPDQATQLHPQPHLTVLPLDVTSQASMVALVQKLKGRPLDIVINNAGVSGPREPARGILDVPTWVNVFATNSVGPAMVAAALKDNLLQGHDKKLINITSQLGSITNHSSGMYPYHASKAALNSLMRGLALEWAADGLLVGLFHPGWVQTDMGGKNANVTPQQSVQGLRQRIAELNASNSGTFRDFKNQLLPW